MFDLAAVGNVNWKLFNHFPTNKRLCSEIYFCYLFNSVLHCFKVLSADQRAGGVASTAKISDRLSQILLSELKST